MDESPQTKRRNSRISPAGIIVIAGTALLTAINPGEVAHLKKVGEVAELRDLPEHFTSQLSLIRTLSKYEWRLVYSELTCEIGAEKFTLARGFAGQVWVTNELTPCVLAVARLPKK